MYQPMLYLHWKQVRLALIPFIVAAFGLPLMAVQGLGLVPGMDGPSLEAYRFMSEVQLWLPFFPALAGGIGVTLALTAWNWDHAHRHVYALSLPLTRVEYTMLKMGAGAALALLPAAAFWMGAHVAAMSITIPEGLNAYPNHLALRFFLAILLSYSLLFAMAAGTIRTTIQIVSAVVVFVVAGNIATELLAPYFDLLTRTNIVEFAFEMMMEAPGPFAVFTGNWSLIDV